LIDASSRTILAISVGVLLAIALLWWPELSFGIGAENAPLGWLQSNWLMACATAAGIRATLCPNKADSSRSAFGWSMLAAALFVAALDERFMFHEQIQDILADVLTGDRFGVDPRRAERWVQGLTVSYALVGLGAAGWLRRVAAPSAWRWMRAAILVGIVAVLTDIASDAMGFQIIEEVLEFAAETLMLCGLVMEARTAANR
jgi:hypothetical protein